MLKILAVLILLVVAVSVLGLASETVERAYASPVVLADTVTAWASRRAIPWSIAFVRPSRTTASGTCRAMWSPCWFRRHSSR